MTEEPKRSGWRWSDDVLDFRIKFVAGMAVVAVVALIGYILLRR